MTIETPVETNANESGTPEPIEQVEGAKKRGRGRPAKNPENSTPEKETPGASPSTGTAKSRKAKAGKFDPQALAKQLVGIHQLGVMMTGGQFPELAISDQEGLMLASGVCAVCEEYDLSIDGKTGAFLQLFGAAAMVYAPRLIAIRARMKHAQPVDVQATEVGPQ